VLEACMLPNHGLNLIHQGHQAHPCVCVVNHSH
jgi:hypothetical protein